MKETNRGTQRSRSTKCQFYRSLFSQLAFFYFFKRRISCSIPGSLLSPSAGARERTPPPPPTHTHTHPLTNTTATIHTPDKTEANKVKGILLHLSLIKQACWSVVLQLLAKYAGILFQRSDARDAAQRLNRWCFGNKPLFVFLSSSNLFAPFSATTKSNNSQVTQQRQRIASRKEKPTLAKLLWHTSMPTNLHIFA